MRDVSYTSWKPPNLDKIQQLASATGFGYGAAGFGDVGYSQHGLIARAERELQEKQEKAEAARREQAEKERLERERIERERAERERAERERKERIRQEERRREEEQQRREERQRDEEAAAERRRIQPRAPENKMVHAPVAAAAAESHDAYSDDDIDDDFEVVDLDTLDVEDFVIVREDFISDSDGGEELLRGQRGQIVEVDEDGDAYIRFRDHRKKQWVYSENLGYLAKVLFDKGDVLHVRRSFECGSIHIRRGQVGVAKRLDAGGDLLVEFDRNVGDQWVNYYSLVFMEKEKPAQSPRSQQKAQAEAKVWLYNPPAFRDVAIRATPDIDGVRTNITLRPGQRFMVSEEHVGTDGILYLKLADGSGWMFESKPGTGVLCIRQNGGMPKDLLSRLSETEPPDDKTMHEQDAKAFLMHMHRILNTKQVRPVIEGLQRELPERIRSVTEVQKSQENELMREKAKRILIDACKGLFKDFGFQVSQEGQQELLEALREHELCNLVYIMATSIELVLQIPPGGWFGLSQLRRGFQVIVKEGPTELVGKKGVLLKKHTEGSAWQVRLDGVEQDQILPSESLVLAADPAAVKEASKAKEIKASASEKELEMEAWQIASLAVVRGRSHGKQLEDAPWWAICHDRASRRATGRLAERELLAIASGSEASWSESLKRPNKFAPPEPLPIEDEKVPCLFDMIEEIEEDEQRDRVRNEFKALARRSKAQPVSETTGGSSSSSGRRRGAFSSRAGALEKSEPLEALVDAEEEQDSDDLRAAEARANRGDIRDLLRREPFACARKDAQLAVMTGKMDRNPGRVAVEGRNDELPPRRTRPQCVKEEFERQRARWHLPPRGKHVGYMPQAHVLGTGQGNLGALEDGASKSSRPRRPQKADFDSNFGGLPDFDDKPGFFGGSGFASFG